MSTTDLLSQEVPSNEQTTTGVTLPFGARVSAVRFETAFEIVDEKYEDHSEDDGTWYELTAHNVGDEPARLTAWIDFE
jgi:hypothetical protein